MSSPPSLAKAAQQAAASLRSSSTSDVLLPDDEDYSQAIRLWNCCIATQPAILVLCRSVADVQQAVRAAVLSGLPLSVHGGGYDLHGRALCAGMVVSLQHMRHVAANPSTETVTFDGGCLLADVAVAVSAHSRAVVTGTTGALGAVGWMLGGGYGQLNARYGLGVDNVISAQVVLADGSLVTASAADKPHDADLLWCLQGGGGGFGVVVSMTVRMHPVSEVLFGPIMFPIDQAAAVLRGYQHLIYQQPDELGCMFYFALSPADGSPLLALAPYWSGDIEQGQQHIQQFEQLGTPIANKVARMPWIDMFKATEGGRYVLGAHASDGDCRSLSHLTDGAIDAMVEAGRHLPPPYSAIVVHDVHNAATRVPADATAFPIRQPHFTILMVSIEKSDTVTNTAREWVQTLSSALEPHSLPQCWPQTVASTEEGRQRLQQTYKDNLPRLLAVKRRVDPHNLFASSVVPL